MIGPLPPPLGGVQIVNRMLVESSLARDFEIHTVDTSKGALRWAVEKQDWTSPLYFVRNVWRLILALARVRPRVYHGTLHTAFPSPRTPFGRWAGRVMMRTAHRVIVLGPTFQREMSRAWRHDGVTWSPNPVEVARFEAAKPGAAAPWLQPGERSVLFVGRLSAPKGFGDLIEAAPAVLAKHPETRFVLCGVAESAALEPRLRDEVERRALAPHVTFLGSLEDADLARAYVSSHVFVSPSWTEAFPLVIPEAMAAGLPMVVTSVGAIPDFIRDGEDGFLVPPHEPAQLADRIIRLLDDEPLRRRMSAHVRARAAREFAIEIGVERVRQVLRDAIG
ncbi:MAG: glycosyltransferase family 4 protein [Candidatus Eisenbacteria bacterium]|nr:glycosyltransferase family 4 protein [Candidatus Eisenbacteria bacterium]